MNTLISNPFLPPPLSFRANNPQIKIKTTNQKIVSARLDDSNQQLNLSVLRFTLGIPGFDESSLPRGIGYAFGSLLLLNHFVGSNSVTTPAQFRTEVLGLSLAAFSVAVPYIGKFLKGATLVDELVLPEGNKQIFSMSECVSDTLKEDLAWGSYVLLKNTKTISVLISIDSALCARGYWSIPDDVSKDSTLDWFARQVQLYGLSDLTDTLYFPKSEDNGIWKMVPNGTRSLLIVPVLGYSELSTNMSANKIRGFILLASSTSYAYSDRDRAWVGAVANKFQDRVAA
ncbi:hypothetical protein ACHQM5_000866 [Ranunculus cassubicifolius]